MREAVESASTAEIGREIGFDMYRLRVPLDEYAHFSDIEEGYRVAQVQDATRVKHASIYQRKLLQIRIRAYRKGIEVTITESDLEAELAACHGVCPVLGTALTSAEDPDTDWSVDRLDNNRGYHPGNIFVMCGQANKWKGDVTFRELILYCCNFELTDDEQQKFDEQPDSTFWSALQRAIYQRMPAEVAAEALQEVYADEDHRQAISEVYLLLVFTRSAFGSRKKVLQVWRSCPLLSVALKQRVVSQDDVFKVRKIAQDVMSREGHMLHEGGYEGGDVANHMMQTMVLRPALDRIIRKLLQHNVEQIRDSASYRAVMFSQLVNPLEEGVVAPLNHQH